MDAMGSRHSSASQGINTFKLLYLPPELVKMVIDHAVFDAAGIMNLALTSTRFFYMIQGHVNKRFPGHIRGPSHKFQNMRPMRETVDSTVSPVNTAWKMDCTYDDPCLEEFRAPRHQTPLVRLIEHYLPVNLGGHYVDDISIEKTYHTIEWMLDKGADVNMDSHPRWYQGPFISATAIAGPHHPPSKPPLHHLLSQLLLRGADHNRINAVVKLVSLLCNRGAVIPAELDHYTKDRRGVTLPGLIMVPSGMVSVAFLARSPPSILESFLTQFSRRNVNWTSRSHRKPKQLEGWWDLGKPYGDGWSFETSPMLIVEVIFNNFFHPDLCYEGDVETLEEKVKLLIKFKAIDEMEQKAFGQLVGVAWEIDALRKQAGGLNFEQHGMVCWYKLTRCITTFDEPSSSGKERWEEDEDKREAEGDRLHAFRSSLVFDVPFGWIVQTAREIFRKVFSQHEFSQLADDAIQTTIFRNDPTKLQLTRDLATFKKACKQDKDYREEQMLLGFEVSSLDCDMESLAKWTRNLTAWNKSYDQGNGI